MRSPDMRAVNEYLCSSYDQSKELLIEFNPAPRYTDEQKTYLSLDVPQQGGPSGLARRASE